MAGVLAIILYNSERKTNQMSLRLEILGIPRPKQSARFRIAGKAGGKQFVASYQKKEVKDSEANIGYTVISQLPEGFVPYDCPIFVTVEYIFPIPKGFSKKQKAEIEAGKKIFKDTKPDLTDNLNKGLFDALSGIVYVNDSRIVVIQAAKYFGITPKTKITFTDESPLG